MHEKFELSCLATEITGLKSKLQNLSFSFFKKSVFLWRNLVLVYKAKSCKSCIKKKKKLKHKGGSVYNLIENYKQLCLIKFNSVGRVSFYWLFNFRGLAESKTLCSVAVWLWVDAGWVAWMKQNILQHSALPDRIGSVTFSADFSHSLSWMFDECLWKNLKVVSLSFSLLCK